MSDFADAAVHDARTGFHDIRLPPMFQPPDYVPVFLIAAAALVLAWLILRLNKPVESPPPPPLPPEEAALNELKEIEQLRDANAVSSRNYGARISAALRSYIEHALDFPASEYTNREVLREITAALKRALPCVGPDSIEELVELTREVLTLAERLTYAPNSEEQASDCGSDAIQLPGKAADIVSEIAKQAKREQERTLSVTQVGVETRGTEAEGANAV